MPQSPTDGAGRLPRWLTLLAAFVGVTGLTVLLVGLLTNIFE